MKILKFFFVAACSSLAFFANGQEQKISVGVKAGVQYANISPKYTDLDNGEITGRTGYTGGLYALYPLQNKMAIQAELLYSTQGNVDKYTLNEFRYADGQRVTFDVNGKIAYELNYLKLPILFQYNVAKNIWIEAGPQLGYLVSGKTKVTQEVVDAPNFEQYYPNSNTKISSEEINKFSYGICAGAYYQINKNFAAGFRFNKDFEKIFKLTDTRYTSWYGNVTISYRLPV